MPDTPDFAALIGSRICHDLISPLGAIGNGVELLAMTSAGDSPEVALISESVASANARIRFFRLAFGAAGAGAFVPLAEVRSILAEMTRGGRLRIHWQIGGDLPRPRVKLAFLALQCLETALPYGGEITLRAVGQHWQAEARADRLMVDAGLWANLTAVLPDAGIAPAQVQFALLPVAAATEGRAVAWDSSDGTVTLTF
jgi:histidine phosphotransferase ChpT